MMGLSNSKQVSALQQDFREHASFFERIRLHEIGRTRRVMEWVAQRCQGFYCGEMRSGGCR